MKKNKIILLGVIILFSGSVNFAAGKKPGQNGTEEEPVKPKLPEQASDRAKEVLVVNWEDKFDKPAVDVIYDIKEMTVGEAKKLNIKNIGKKKDTEKVKVKYPEVVFLKASPTPGRSDHIASEARFMDISGNTKKLLTIKDGINTRDISRNRKYISFTWPYRTKKTGGTVYETKIINTSGDLISNIKHPDSIVRVSPNGKYILVSSGMYDDIIAIYNSEGLIKKIESASVSSADFAPDGSWFTVIAKLESTYEYDLIVCDEKGNELWRKEKISQNVGSVEVKISDNEKITVMTGVSEYKVYKFDKQGNVLEKRQGILKELREFR